MSAEHQAYEVVIIGGGAAGATAATALARRRRRVLLVDETTSPGPGIDWLSPHALPFLKSLGLASKAWSAQRIARLTFVSEDLSRQCEVRLARSTAFAVNRSQLQAALTAAAKRAGATVQAASLESLEVQEECVHGGDARGQEFTGRLVLAASGPQSLAARRLGLQLQADAPPRLRVHACLPAKPGAGGGPARLTMMLAEATAQATALILLAESGAAVTLYANAEPEQLARQFERFIAQATQAGFLPEGAAEHVPASTAETFVEVPALEMDTHVGKRGLLIGPAGGFASLHSGEELWPAIHSAQLAAKVIDHALGARTPQDALAAFDHLWRTRMAQALAWPQTNLQLVLPLVFSNRPMARRLARSLLLGTGL